MDSLKRTAAMVALIKAATCEPDGSRRAAAAALLDLLRSMPNRALLSEQMTPIAAAAGPEVAADVGHLVEQLNIGGPADLLP